MAESADELIRAAGQAKSRGDWDTAYRLLRRAGKGKTALPVDALADLGLAAWWLGHTAETIDLAEQVHERCIADGDVEQAARNAVDLAFTWTLRGDPALGLGWLARARRLLEGRPDCLAAGLIRYVDASIALDAYDLGTARDEAEALQDMGQRIASTTLSSLGLLIEGVALIRSGHPSDGFALLDESMLPVVAERIIAEFAGSIYCTIISVCVDVADVRRARHWTETTQNWCDRFSTATMFAGVCRVHRAQLQRIDGSLDEAEREARLVCDELADINRGAVAEAMYELGEIHRLRGELDAAARWYGGAADGGISAEPGASRLLLSRGAHASALRQIGTAIASAGPSPFARARLLEALVDIALAADRLGAARTANHQLDRIAHEFPTPGLRAASLRTSGAVLLADGQFDRSRAALTNAATLYRDNQQPYAHACVHDLLAQCLRAGGRLDDAITHAETAAALFDGMGAVAPPRQVHADHPGGLTGREMEVLRHVADGASNR